MTQFSRMSAAFGLLLMASAVFQMDPATAQVSLPPAARFFGGITVNGQNAHTGAVVTAYSGTTLCGTSNAAGSYNGTIYLVDIDGNTPACATTGTQISFRVDGQPANETGSVPAVPNAVRIDLTVTGGSGGTSTTGTASYAAGWNLVGVPSGTILSQAANPLYTYPSGATDYTQVSNTTGLQAGTGYWAYFTAPTTVTLSGTATLPATVNNSAGGYVMVGNPSPSKPVTVSGADVVYTYGGAAGYQVSSSLAPGQGAWAYCANPCTVTIR